MGGMTYSDTGFEPKLTRLIHTIRTPTAERDNRRDGCVFPNRGYRATDRAGAQTGRALALLAGNSQKVESRTAGWRVRFLLFVKPHDPIAITIGSERIGLFARRFATLATGATLQVDHQCELGGVVGHGLPQAVMYHQLMDPPSAA